MRVHLQAGLAHSRPMELQPLTMGGFDAGAGLDTPATIGEADWQYARAVGQDSPDREWILSDRDVWYRNPSYRGPLTPHPEECLEDEEAYDALVFALNFTGPCQPLAPELAELDDVPF